MILVNYVYEKDGNTKNTTVANYLVISGNLASKNIDEKIYYNNNFYININDINNIDKYMDYGQIIYGDRAKEIEYYGKKLK